MTHDGDPIYTDADFIRDDLQRCDLVMKGGIASGVVYPPAIIELATRYQFVNIGGTSAGAIAAAAAAAAEYGRTIPYAGYRSGFQRLDRLRAWLGANEGNLAGLFQPSPNLKPLFHTLLDLVIASKTALPPKRASARQQLPSAVRIPVAALQFVGRALSLFLRTARLLMRYNTAVTLGVGVAAALIIAAIWTLLSLLSDTPVQPLISVGRVALSILVGLIIGVLAGAVHLVWIAVAELPRSLFGLCSGHAAGAIPEGWPPTLGDTEGRGRPPALTDWLHAAINGLAGRAADQPPLTFGELAHTPDGRRISLRMMTSNLSEHMPYVLPKDMGRFLFDPTEFARLFPEIVVEHMRARSAGAAYQVKDERGVVRTLLPLPAWRDLPVVFGVRLSLSFPILIAAVPLYTISVAGQRDASAGRTLRAEHLQRHLFSDGGIASNFPIHFFDRWLPTHPTFGINLVQLSADEIDDEQFLQTLLADDGTETSAEAPKPGVIVKQAYLGRANFRAAAPEPPPPFRAAAPFSNPQEEVYLPPAGPSEDYIEWRAITSLPAFFWSIFGTAQNYRDAAQARLPGYNERVVRVRLRPEEGGLNLRMPPRIVAAIMRKGRLAGRALLPQEPEAAGRRRGGFRFDDHRWVRLVTLLSEIDQQLRDMRAAYDDVQADYPSFLRDALTNDKLPVCPPYYLGNPEERALFARRIEALIALYTLWSDLDEATTARLNTILLRMNKRTLQDLARLLDQPD
ncbi:MAG: patatin-like phospholipase family protein, partial [Roseiflexus sp.]|nr:patatin-like phospholipase family protein [Roseiflexus sp.]